MRSNTAPGYLIPHILPGTLSRLLSASLKSQQPRHSSRLPPQKNSRGRPSRYTGIGEQSCPHVAWPHRLQNGPLQHSIPILQPRRGLPPFDCRKARKSTIGNSDTGCRVYLVVSGGRQFGRLRAVHCSLHRHDLQRNECLECTEREVRELMSCCASRQQNWTAGTGTGTASMHGECSRERPPVQDVNVSATRII